MAEAKKMGCEASTSGPRGGGDGGVSGSVVVDAGRRKSTCGYCKSVARTSISHGLWAHSLTVDDYQALLDRGWRRSGCFLYKPDMEKTCCPSYTIRLKVTDFVPSKEHIRISKRMQRFLDGKLDVKKTCNETNTSGGGIGHQCAKNQAVVESLASSSKDKDEADQLMRLLSSQIDSSLRVYLKSFDFSTGIELPKASLRKVGAAKRKLQAQQSEELVFSCSISFQVAATLRRLKKDVDCVNSVKLSLGDKDLSEFSPNVIAEILARHAEHLAESHGLSVRGCNGHINFYASPNHADVIQVGRGPIASDTAATATATARSAKDRRLKKACEGIQTQRRRLEIRLRRSCFDYEEYSLYRKYQLTVHNDKSDNVTESSYKRFLVDTPLLYMPSNGDVAVPPCGFGSFHQQYVIDGKLVAVGVIDILPKCLSSKYLFWDPDLAVLSLGKYSVLQEISCVHENQIYCPSLQYYYLGYYIHSCSKMRYKAAYRPSELLCPLRYQWVPYDTARPLLDSTKYAVLSDKLSSHNGELSPPDTTSQIEEQPSDSPQEASNDVLVNDEEMAEADSDYSEDEFDAETSDTSDLEQEDVGLGNVLIGVRGLRLNYKDIQHAFDPSQRSFMESQLRKYVNVVGRELSEKMVYSLG